MRISYKGEVIEIKNSKGDILDAIDKLRLKMYLLALNRETNDSELLETGRKLKQLLEEYYSNNKGSH